MQVQISLFDFITEPDMLTDAVKRGSGFVGGKTRIRQAVETTGGDVSLLASFLKKEYGTGGSAGPGQPKIDYDSRGLKVGMTWDDRKQYTLEQVAKRVIELVAMNRY